MKKVFVFPGQGSQKKDMCKDIYDNFAVAKQIFQESSDALGYDIAKIIFNEDETQLNNTQYTQPALMTTSIAVLEVIKKESGKSVSQLCNAVCGHSLGEYSSLCASGVISLQDTAKLLKVRGEAMNNSQPGAMAAILGGEISEINSLIEKTKLHNEYLVIANDNSTGQVVISGHVKSIDNFIANVSSTPSIKRAIKLNVSGAFHSPIMKDAELKMQEAIANTKFNKPNVDFFANVSASKVDNIEHIKNGLVKQMTSMVRWRETMLNLEMQQYSALFEIGSGKVLCGLAKKTTPNIITNSIGTIEELKSFLESIQ